MHRFVGGIVLIGLAGCGQVVLPDGGVGPDGGAADVAARDAALAPDADSGREGPDASLPDMGGVDSEADAGFLDAAVPLHIVQVTRAGPGLGDVRSSDGLIVCGDICATEVAHTSTVTLVAQAREHYRFAGWGGACAGLEPSCELTVQSALNVQARFEFVPKIAAGFWHACATNETGALRCWGQNDSGQLGYGHTNDVGGPQHGTALQQGDVPVGGLVEDVAIGGGHSCAVLQGGEVRCWGLGAQGQLGYGSASSLGGSASTLPAAAGSVALSRPARSVVAGQSHSCAVLVAGQVECWGSNARGQLGYGDVQQVGHQPGSVPATVGPVPVGGLVVELVAGGLHTCALINDGSVRCWGRNNNGQLGLGGPTDSVVGAGRNNTPAAAGAVPLGGLAKRLTSTGGHTCAEMVAGGVRCWGLGLDGRLGNGSENDIGHSGLTPDAVALVDLGRDLLFVKAGQTQTCALFDSGMMKCWGDDRRNALGYGPPMEQIGDDPGEVSPSLAGYMLGAPVADIALGGYFTCGRQRTGVIRCWGESTTGGLGNGLEQWHGAAADAPETPVF